jgi:hypothetical protein
LLIDSEGEGVLTVSAVQSVAIAEATGDMRLQSVESLVGDVRLEAAAGSIVDRNAIETKDTRTLEALQAFWNAELGLGETFDPNDPTTLGPRASAQVAALETEMTDLYRAYWSERTANGSAPVTFTLDAATRASFESSLSRSEPEFVQVWITSYESRLSALYETWNTTLTAFDPTFRYTAMVEDKTAVLQGMGWSDEDLTRRIQSGLVIELGDTNIRDESPNVSAKGDITLVVQDRVGELLPDYVIGKKDRFSEADLEVLYGATRDDLTVDVTLEEIRVRRNEDLNFAFTSDGGLPTGKLTVEAANSDIFMAAETPTALADVTGTQAVEIRVDGLVSDLRTGDFAIEGRAIVLESGNDDAIGSQSVPVTVNVLMGGTLRANAGTDLFVTAPSSDLPLLGIFAGGTAQLVAAGAMTDAVGTDVARVVATHIDLDGASIGSGAAPMGLRVLDPETGSVRLVSRTGDVVARAHSNVASGVISNLPLTELTSAAGGRLDTAGSERLIFSGTDTMRFATGGTFVIDTGGGIGTTASSGTDITGGTLTLTSDGTVGSVANPLRTQLVELTFATRTPASTVLDTTLVVLETDALRVPFVMQNANPASDTRIAADGRAHHFRTVGNDGAGHDRFEQHD